MPRGIHLLLNLLFILKIFFFFLIFLLSFSIDFEINYKYFLYIPALDTHSDVHIFLLYSLVCASPSFVCCIMCSSLEDFTFLQFLFGFSNSKIHIKKNEKLLIGSVSFRSWFALHFALLIEKKIWLYKKYFLLYNSHCLGCLSDQPCPRNIGD